MDKIASYEALLEGHPLWNKEAGAASSPWKQNPGAYASFDPMWRELPETDRPSRRGLFGLGGYGELGSEDLTVPRLRKILQSRKRRGRMNDVDRWLTNNPQRHHEFIRWYRGA